MTSAQSHAHLPLGTGAEFDAIRAMLGVWGAQASGIGDDAALLSVPEGEVLVASTDASFEHVHFRREWLTPREIGARAAAAALSDLAAMAARPIGLLFALVLPEAWRDDASAIASGVGKAARTAGCRIIGGNVSSGESLSITTTVLGTSAKPLTRSGAKPGDSVFVTGNLGGAAAAVAAWESGHPPEAKCRERFVQPSARIEEAIWLAAHGASSAIDLSDGLSTDAGHVALASGVSMVIDVERVPLATGATLNDALSGGEDYELLVTAADLDGGEFQRIFGTPLTRIGAVEAGAGAVFTKAGKPFTPRTGFDHLSVK